VVITHQGFELVLRFAPGDFYGKGQPQELWLRPGTQELKLGVLLRFAPGAKEYLQYARAAMRILGPEGTPGGRTENYRASADALRELAGPGRGLPPGFYRQIADLYMALVEDGEPHPIKKLSEINHVTISAASRWVSEAKRRKLIRKKASA
jgi:hypothetical protein